MTRVKNNGIHISEDEEMFEFAPTLESKGFYSTVQATVKTMSNAEQVEVGIRDLLIGIGENPDREGLVKTPDRVRRAYEYMTKGYHEKVDDIIHGAVFKEKSDEMVVVSDIDFYSICEHHLLPFFGKCHVAYLPKNHVIGLSKIPRIVDIFSRRLQIQERLTTQIANAIKDALNPLGVGVMMEAQHLCTIMRGVQKQNNTMVTSCLFGAFKQKDATRAEFFNIVNSRRNRI